MGDAADDLMEREMGLAGLGGGGHYGEWEAPLAFSRAHHVMANQDKTMELLGGKSEPDQTINAWVKAIRHALANDLIPDGVAEDIRTLLDDHLNKET